MQWTSQYLSWIWLFHVDVNGPFGRIDRNGEHAIPIHAVDDLALLELETNSKTRSNSCYDSQTNHLDYKYHVEGHSGSITKSSLFILDQLIFLWYHFCPSEFVGGSILNEPERLSTDKMQKDKDMEGVSMSHWQHSLSEKHHRRRHLSKLRAGTAFCGRWYQYKFSKGFLPEFNAAVTSLGADSARREKAASASAKWIAAALPVAEHCPKFTLVTVENELWSISTCCESKS